MPRTYRLSPVPPLGWVLIANAARARSFVRDHENRLKGQALSNDRGGKIQKSIGASSQFDPHTDLHRKEHTQFARELAQYLEDSALAHRYPEVSLIASKAFLGELRLHLGPATQKLLRTCVPLDLTIYEGSDLEHRVAQALQGSLVGA